MVETRAHSESSAGVRTLWRGRTRSRRSHFFRCDASRGGEKSGPRNRRGTSSQRSPTRISGFEGGEIAICDPAPLPVLRLFQYRKSVTSMHPIIHDPGHIKGCLLYTSDAADEEDSVDLVGFRL